MKPTSPVLIMVMTIASSAIAAPVNKRSDSLVNMPVNINAEHAVDAGHVADHWNWNQLADGTVYAPGAKRSDSLLDMPVNINAEHAVDGGHVADHWNWNQLSDDTVYAPGAK
ncbi:MAG: hypothetical protein JOS17DRAFT_795147 [Linnemannia elongata]|nr:MAG: hypothetical protein JOS17DRAFT_795147 [Linnemannia elongata]